MTDRKWEPVPDNRVWAWRTESGSLFQTTVFEHDKQKWEPIADNRVWAWRTENGSQFQTTGFEHDKQKWEPITDNRVWAWQTENGSLLQTTRFEHDEQKMGACSRRHDQHNKIHAALENSRVWSERHANQQMSGETWKECAAKKKKKKKKKNPHSLIRPVALLLWLY